MDAVSIATTLVGLQQQRIQSAVQVAVARTERAQGQAVLDMIATSTDNLRAAAAAGTGRLLDRTA